MSVSGRIVRRDLMTRDVIRARDFYTELFGWTIREREVGSSSWNLVSVGGTGIGAIAGTAKDDPFPPHWIASVAVDDVDAGVERARAAGGDAPIPGMDVPGVGRVAVVRDPAGARLRLVRLAEPVDAPPDSAPVGHFCWEDLLTNDVEAAVRFYGEVLGWTTRTMDVPGAGRYTIFVAGDRDVGGATALPPDAAAPPHWLSYVRVANVDAAASRIEELGGRVHRPPSDLDGIGRLAVGADSGGAVFAVWTPKA